MYVSEPAWGSLEGGGDGALVFYVCAFVSILRCFVLLLSAGESETERSYLSRGGQSRGVGIKGQKEIRSQNRVRKSNGGEIDQGRARAEPGQSQGRARAESDCQDWMYSTPEPDYTL